MENKLEQLLNSLVNAGWKPRNKEEVKMLNYHTMYREVVSLEFENYNLPVSYSIRDLVSVESQLWQFVCENGMVNVDETEVYYFWLKRKGTLDRGHYYLSEAGEDIRTNNFEYRLIESSLKDESELEDFLLSNIVIKDE